MIFENYSQIMSYRIIDEIQEQNILLNKNNMIATFTKKNTNSLNNVNSNMAVPQTTHFNYNINLGPSVITDKNNIINLQSRDQNTSNIRRFNMLSMTNLYSVVIEPTHKDNKEDNH